MVLSYLHGGHCFDDNVEHDINPGVHVFQKISELIENSRCQKSGMNEGQNWGPTNSMCIRHQYKIWWPRQTGTQDLCTLSPGKFLLCFFTVTWQTLSTYCTERCIG